VSKAAALTTVAVERVFDGLTMLLFLVITSFFFPFPAQIQQALRIGGFVFLGVLALCYIMLWQQKLAQHIISSLLSFLPPGLQNKLQTLVESIFTGMSVLRGAKDMVAVNGLSIVTWVMEAVMYHFVLLAFDIPQPFYVSLTLLAVVNLFIIVPGPPGYFGPFEFACKIVLTVSSIGVSEQRAIAYALILHVVGQWLPSTLLGLYYMWREHISFHEVEDRPQPSR